MVRFFFQGKALTVPKMIEHIGEADDAVDIPALSEPGEFSAFYLAQRFHDPGIKRAIDGPELPGTNFLRLLQKIMNASGDGQDIEIPICASVCRRHVIEPDGRSIPMQVEGIKPFALVLGKISAHFCTSDGDRPAKKLEDFLHFPWTELIAAGQREQQNAPEQLFDALPFVPIDGDRQFRQLHLFGKFEYPVAIRPEAGAGIEIGFRSIQLHLSHLLQCAVNEQRKLLFLSVIFRCC